MTAVTTGIVRSLHRWPVKSMGGERVDALRLDGRGAAGDRTHALFDDFRGAPRCCTVRQVPRMLTWAAHYAIPGAELDPASPPLPVLTGPDGRRFAWDDPALPAALEANLGRPLTLHRELRGQQDLGDTVLVTTQATLDAVGEALGRPLDLRRFRTNVHVVLDAPAFAEETWQGRTLLIGDAKLALLHPCERCVIPTRDPDSGARDAEILRWLARERRTLFGINARPLGPSLIREGDAITLA